MGRAFLAAVVVALLSTSAFAHGGRWIPPPPPPPRPAPPLTPPGAEPGGKLPGGGKLPPGWKQPSAEPGTARTPETTPSPAHHWSRWWRLNREALLHLHLRRNFQRVAAVSGPRDSDGVPAKRKRWEELRRQITEALIAASASKDPDLATGAIIALGRARCREALPVLRRLAVSVTVDTTIRESALLALALIDRVGEFGADSGEETRKFLTERLAVEGRPERERGFALLALGIHGNMASIPYLMRDAVNRDRPGHVRATAAYATGLIQIPLMHRDLRRLTLSPVVPDIVRVHAAAAIGRQRSAHSRPVLLAALAADCGPLRCQAALSLGALAEADDDEVRKALEGVLDAEAPTLLGPFAAIALGEIGAAESLPALRRAYRRGDPVLAKHAALALGLLARNPEDLDVRDKVCALIRGQLAEFGDTDLSAALAVAAATAMDGRVVARLRERLNGGKDPRVKAHVAVALGILGVREVAPDLRKILGAAKDPVLLQETAFALDLLADREAAKILIRLLREGEFVSVRGAAASAAGRLHSPAAAEALLAVLTDGKERTIVRAFAAVGLGFYLEKDPVLSDLGARLFYPLVEGALAEVLTFF